MISRYAPPTPLLLLAACLLCASAVAAAVAAAEQQPSCPSLFSGSSSGARDAAVVQACSSGDCQACQCALVRKLLPALVREGRVLRSEAFMGSTVTRLADTMAACKRAFEVQLMQHTTLSLAQLSSLEACAADAKAVGQCMPAERAQRRAADNATTSTAVVSSAGDDDDSDDDAAAPLDMWDEMLSEACAASMDAAAAGNATSSAGCPSPLAARLAAGMPASAARLASMRAAGSDGPSVLSITAANTRGTTQWRANCWCDETYDPVCDPDTRKQYPNACSAKCQMVAQPVPCAVLSPLVNASRAGNTAVYVIDVSLMRAGAGKPYAAAFDGPIPPEAAANSQSFYYYYEDDADDTKEAVGIAGAVAEALLDAKLGGRREAAAAAAVSNALPPAIKAGAASSVAKAADGPAAPATNATRAAMAANITAGSLANSVMSDLRNITLRRQRVRRAVDQPSRVESVAPAERTTVATVPVAAVSGMPAPPSWMLTGAPGQAAGVYTRDAQRTSRIVASLMAAAREARGKTQAARLVINVAPALDGVVRAASGAAQALRPFADGLFGAGVRAASSTMRAAGLARNASSLNGTSSINGTSAINGTATNGTDPATAEPSVGLDGIMAELAALPDALPRRAAALNGSAATMLANGTMANGTTGSNATNGTATPRTAPASRRRRPRFFFF